MPATPTSRAHSTRLWLDRGTELAAARLARTARQEDVDEWVIGTGAPIIEALPQAVRGSLLSRCLWAAGEPLAMWGCQSTEHAEDMRQVWFVASTQAARRAVAIHRHFKDAIAELQPPGVRLRASTYWRNAKHHRWLETHGFVLEGHAYSCLGVPYFSYVRKPTQPCALQHCPLWPLRLAPSRNTKRG